MRRVQFGLVYINSWNVIREKKILFAFSHTPYNKVSLVVQHRKIFFEVEGLLFWNYVKMIPFI